MSSVPFLFKKVTQNMVKDEIFSDFWPLHRLVNFPWTMTRTNSEINGIIVSKRNMTDDVSVARFISLFFFVLIVLTELLLEISKPITGLEQTTTVFWLVLLTSNGNFLFSFPSSEILQSLSFSCCCMSFPLSFSALTNERDKCIFCFYFISTHLGVYVRKCKIIKDKN